MKRALAAPPSIALAVPVFGYRNAVADPIARRANAGFRSWPAGAPPVRVALLADIDIQRPPDFWTVTIGPLAPAAAPR